MMWVCQTDPPSTARARFSNGLASRRATELLTGLVRIIAKGHRRPRERVSEVGENITQGEVIGDGVKVAREWLTREGRTSIAEVASRDVRRHLRDRRVSETGDHPSLRDELLLSGSASSGQSYVRSNGIRQREQVKDIDGAPCRQTLEANIGERIVQHFG